MLSICYRYLGLKQFLRSFLTSDSLRQTIVGRCFVCGSNEHRNRLSL